MFKLVTSYVEIQITTDILNKNLRRMLTIFIQVSDSLILVFHKKKYDVTDKLSTSF